MFFQAHCHRGGEIPQLPVTLGAVRECLDNHEQARPGLE